MVFQPLFLRVYVKLGGCISPLTISSSSSSFHVSFCQSIGQQCLSIAIIKRTSWHSQAHLVNMSAIHRRNDEIHGSTSVTSPLLSKQSTEKRVDSGSRRRRIQRGFGCFLHQVVCEEKSDSLEREQSIYCNRNGYLRTRIFVYLYIYIHKAIHLLLSEVYTYVGRQLFHQHHLGCIFEHPKISVTFLVSRARPLPFPSTFVAPPNPRSIL